MLGLALLWLIPRGFAIPVEILTPTRPLPAHLSAALDRSRACVENSKGELLVLDAGAHAVFSIDAKRATLRRVIAPGAEWGHILKPSAFAIGSEDIFAIADTPGPYDRVQYFSPTGALLGRFFAPGAPGARISVGGLVLNGIGTMQFTGKVFLFTVPSTNALMMEVAPDGQPLRSIGALRPTGHESDRPLHLALNAGLPLVDPTGGFYFVFQTGLPLFRKYDANGVLVFERHIEGAELDATLQSIPTTWPKRSDAEAVIPYAPPSVTSAAVDRDGRLWVSLAVPFTYVYDPSGEKVRVVQFKGERGGAIIPTSMFFGASSRLLVAPGCDEFSGE